MTKSRKNTNKLDIKLIKKKWQWLNTDKEKKVREFIGESSKIAIQAIQV